MRTIVDSDRRGTAREIAERLDLWVSHWCGEVHLTQRINIYGSLLKRNEIDPFLKRQITGDEKWIIYNNVNRKRSWVIQDEPAQTTPKAEIRQKKDYAVSLVGL